MQSLIKYINENLENLGGINPYKNKEKFYLNFPLFYSAKLELEQFKLKIKNIKINYSDVGLNNKPYNFFNVFNSCYSTYYPEYNELEKEYKDINYTLKKLIPQGILKNMAIADISDAEDTLYIRNNLAQIDPSLKYWENIIDKKANTINKAELKIKDLLNKKSGILNITFELKFICYYTLLVTPIYYKNKKEVSRFDIKIINKKFESQENLFYFTLYNIASNINKNEKFNNDDLKELIDKREIRPFRWLMVEIPTNNRNINKFLNKFIINKFEVNKNFFIEQLNETIS